jgi:hypothetical protein
LLTLSPAHRHYPSSCASLSWAASLVQRCLVFVLHNI